MAKLKIVENQSRWSQINPPTPMGSPSGATTHNTHEQTISTPNILHNYQPVLNRLNIM